MTPDNGTQGQGPAVVGESGISEANPPMPVKGPATDIPAGSDNLSGGDGPASIFDVLSEMVGEEDPSTDALRNILVNNGSIVKAKNENGSTPLHVAATKGPFEAVKVLLESQASVSAEDDWGRQPLHLACSHGNTDIIRLLLDEGADFEARWDGHTPVEEACWSGQVDAVELLIARGARVSVADKNGFSSLFIASALGYEKIAKVFLETDKSNIDQAERRYGRTPLHVAIISGSRDIASMLIDEGAAVNLQDSKGQTALYVAISGKYPKLVNRLLDKGAKPEIKDNDDWTALHFVAQSSDKEITTKVLSKVPRNAINAKDKYGWTALHVASRQGNASVVRAILGDEGICSTVEIDVENNDGNTALHLASGALGGSADKFKPDDDSETSSEEKAVLQGAIIEALLDAGADLNIKNKQGKTSIDLIMADEEPYRFRGLLAYVSLPFLFLESPSTYLDTKKKEVNDLLAREGFFKLLAKLVDQSPPGTTINTTLKSTLYMILDVLGDDDNRPLLKHFPSALGLLIAASSPNDHLNARLKNVAMSIASISKPMRTHHSKEKPQTAQQTSIAIFNRENKENLQEKGKEVNKSISAIPEAKSSQTVPEDLLKNLDDIGDILRDPPFSQLHKDDYSKFINPKAKKELQGVLEGFEAVVVQFYKERGASGSLLSYRSVNEVIYGAGPTTIMGTRSHDKNFKFENGPRFSWVHLPSTNMVWMQDLMMRIMKEEIDMTKAKRNKDRTEQYFALRSFFQDSWIQVPDSETPSRVMKPRALRQNGTIPSQDKRDKDRKPDVVESQGLVPNPEASVSQDGCDKDHNTVEVKPAGDRSVRDSSVLQDGSDKDQSSDFVEREIPHPEQNIPQASAVYMPYLCFSTCHNEARDELNDPERLKAYHALLDGYQDSVIHESPTLDEWYYHFDTDEKSAEDRRMRNRGQVVTKFLKEQKKTTEVPNRNPAARTTGVIGWANEGLKAAESSSDDHWILLRVNQIWIWTFADKWIISASSCSLDDNHETLVEGILGQLKKQVEYGGSDSQPTTTEAMEKLIVDYCVASYERKPAGKPNMSISQIFSNYMNRIGRGETALFHRLSRRATGDAESAEDTADSGSTISSNPDGALDKGLAKSWEEKMRKSIKFAESLFTDIKDVRDELNILKSAARFQKKVQRDLAKDHVKDTSLSADYIENDIMEMDNVANRIQSALHATLSLQQSAIANEQAETANEQAEIARQQNKVLVTFTVATILFLPLSFLSSLFALDAESFSKTPSWVFFVIFLVSIGVSGIILVTALSVNKLATMRENKAQTALSSDAKGQTKPRTTSSSTGTANTVGLNGGGVFGGRLRYRHGRTKLGDQELGNMTRSEGR